MSIKEDTRDRLSVTTKPTTALLLTAMVKETKHVEERPVQHRHRCSTFRLGCVEARRRHWREVPGDRDFEPVQIYIPGMTTPFGLHKTR